MRRVLSLVGGLRRLVGLLLLVGVVLGGAGVATGVLGAPSVEGIENRFGEVDETATVVETDVRVHNPNPIGVRLGGTTLEYAVSMNDVGMARGRKTGLELPRGDHTVSIDTTVANRNVTEWWVSHVRNDERTTVALDASVHSSAIGRTLDAPPVEREVTTDIDGALDDSRTRPVNANQPFVSDPVVYVNETRGEIGAVTDEETPIRLAFDVYNPKPYPVAATALDYEIAMNGVEMGAGSTDRSVTIPPGRTRTIEATTTVRNERVPEWWVTHVERNQVTDLAIDVYVRFDFGGDSVRLPIGTVEHRLETDVFGNKNETAANESDASTPTADGTTATPTRDSPTRTAEPTADGGLLGGDGTATATPEDGTATSTPDGATATATEDDGLLGV